MSELNPWHLGGKEDFLDRMGLSMTHDELAALIGPAYQQIIDAGFVLVPRHWRNSVQGIVTTKAEESRTT